MAKRSRRSTRRGGVQDPEYEEGEMPGPRPLPPATPPSGTQESGLSNTAPTGTGAAGQGTAASGSSAGRLMTRSEGVGVTPSGQGRRSSRRRGTKKSRKARKVSRRR